MSITKKPSLWMKEIRLRLNFKNHLKSIFRRLRFHVIFGCLENLNAIGLKYLSIEALVACVAVFLFFTLRNISRFLVERKKSDLANTHIVKFNLMNYVLILFLFIFSSLLALKIYDSTKLKRLLNGFRSLSKQHRVKTDLCRHTS